MSDAVISSSSLLGVTDHVLDTSGLMCPEPVMLLHQKVKVMSKGEILLMTATDSSSERDITKFCQFLNYDLVDVQRMHAYNNYYIRKK